MSAAAVKRTRFSRGSLTLLVEDAAVPSSRRTGRGAASFGAPFAFAAVPLAGAELSDDWLGTRPTVSTNGGVGSTA
jgi:hypothetical protein